jgi:hypothetical protein
MIASHVAIAIDKRDLNACPLDTHIPYMHDRIDLALARLQL